MTKVFGDFDMEHFWEPSKYADEQYVGAPFTNDQVAVIERELGYKLPASYVEFMRFQNGGIPKKTKHRTPELIPWDDHIFIHGIFSIGRKKSHSLCGYFGSQFWIDEWEYPAIGIYFADCPSGGHDMVCLDYRECGPRGKPRVVYVEQERDYKITFVAESFEAFIRGLESNETFENEA